MRDETVFDVVAASLGESSARGYDLAASWEHVADTLGQNFPDSFSPELFWEIGKGAEAGEMNSSDGLGADPNDDLEELRERR